MVGSITFTRKKGDRVRKGDEVVYRSYRGSPSISCTCKNHRSFVDDQFTATPGIVQLGYFSFGGSTCICVFQQVLQATSW